MGERSVIGVAKLWRVLFVERRMPWRLSVALWTLKKRLLTMKANLVHRRPPWLLFRMIDPRRIRPGSVPVVINSYNRLEALKIEVEWILGLDGEPSVIILDNASDYPPLLAYYASLDHPHVQVVFLGYNSGLEGLEDLAGELKRFPKFVITDPDLVPYPDTPSDILSRMSDFLDRYPQYRQVGASMEIRDIPDCYPLREQVRQWEARYWPPEAAVVEEGAFEAWVDTTFGMYRSNSDVTRIEPAVRLDRPYTLRHVDWYLDPDNLNEEQEQYLAACTRVASWNDHLLRTGEGAETDVYKGPNWRDRNF